jgi:SPW repeat
MPSTRFFNVHRSWEDWCSLGLGLLILLSPMIAQTSESPYMALNAVVIGLLLMLFGWSELMLIEAWEEYLELVLGLWLVASPWVFGYSHLPLLTAAHIVLGGAVAALAVLELWQDRWRTGHAA